MWIAHKNEDGQREQSILEHLKGTANRAQEFANPFGCGEYGRCLGMLHDIGKYSEGFRERILNGGGKVDHSTAGAQLVWELSNTLNARIASYCVAGHHTGLPDGGSAADHEAESTLSARLQRPVEDYQAFRQEIDPSTLLPTQEPPLRLLGKAGFTISFFTRMLYSCLVDADFLDTERFMSNGSVARDPGEPLPILRGKLAQYLKKFDHPQNDLNRMRCNILNRCLQMAENGRGLFTLTVPTGGGKTLSSLAFALEHAKHNEQRRVIYVIPTPRSSSRRQRNSARFWAIGTCWSISTIFNTIMATTESTRAASPPKIGTNPLSSPPTSSFLNPSSQTNPPAAASSTISRGSVIIFDEAQMLPREYLIPCVRAISELVQNYGCTAVLCTATQPALQKLFPPEIRATEIMEDVPALYSFFKRTELQPIGPLSNEALIERLGELEQVLCIVNTKKHASDLYEALKDENTFCLTTLMYPLHRTTALSDIKGRLKDGLPCRVIATSLVEAGVDFDFPTVYRAEAGLDSIIQAAGRCNREGKRPAEESIVSVFQPEEAYQNSQASFAMPRDVALSVIQRYADIASAEAIHSYFEKLYKNSGNGLDQKNIVNRFEEGAQNAFLFPFETVAKEFHLIDEQTRTILIPVEKTVAELAKRLRRGERNQRLMREIGPYCVSVYENHYEALDAISALEVLDDEIAILTDLSLYDEKTGLSMQSGKGGIGLFS